MCVSESAYAGVRKCVRAHVSVSLSVRHAAAVQNSSVI